MANAIFLSAGVPDPKADGGGEYARTADPVAITAAVAAVVHVVLGRRMLIWGGHPAISAMIHVLAEDYGVDYAEWVRLYQSLHFRDEFPEDNARYHNVVYIDADPAGRGPSLSSMREAMFGREAYDAAVFVGGMGGIIDEYEMLRRMQPRARTVPLASTGGASLILAGREFPDDAGLREDLGYVRLLHDRLNISVRERRYRTPADQPVLVEDRFVLPRR